MSEKKGGEQRSRGAEERRSGGAEEQRSGGAEEQRSGGAEERRSRGAEEQRKKRELIIFGYNAQEIPPKISFTRQMVYSNNTTCEVHLYPPKSPLESRAVSFPGKRRLSRGKSMNFDPQIDNFNQVNKKLAAKIECLGH
ncbi:MAG: hypothetical protein F6K41_43610 [Symploca sp. SIO3E6]|nr:hypothetical protein [Caldora sp. SIO3E6]